jgi:hypothetical protein
MESQLLSEPFPVSILSDSEKKESETSQSDSGTQTPKSTNAPNAQNQIASNLSRAKKKMRPNALIKDVLKHFNC